MATSQDMTAGVQRVRVLLVEDEFLVSDMIAEILALHGFEVHAAANADEALEHLTGGEACDILLTDLNLGPGLDGVALARMVRGNAARSVRRLRLGFGQPAGRVPGSSR